MPPSELMISAAEPQARAMLACLPDSIDLEDLGEYPVRTVEQIPGLTVVRVANADASSGCSVLGRYEPDPPTIFVAESENSRRMGFTALHELGHHLQRTNLELGEAKRRQDRPNEFEEVACDLFASIALIPDDRVNAHILKNGPDARSVETLYRLTRASRQATAIRLSRFIRGSGVIVVFDEAGEVLSAAPKNNTYPPAKGSDQSSTALVQAALRNREYGTGAQGPTTIVYSSHESPPLYGDAVWCDDYLIAVMMPANAPWLKFSPPMR